MPWDHFDRIIAAVLTGAGAILATSLAYRHRMRKLGETADDVHLTTFYKTLNDALTAQEARHADSLNQVREEQREERRQWAEERAALNGKIDKLQEQGREDAKAIHRKEMEVVELRAEVRVLTERLGTSGTHVSPSEVNVKLS